MFQSVPSKEKRPSRQSRERMGRFVEWFVIIGLLFKGYRLIKHRYKNHGGEVDIILKDGQSIVFLEVKYRKNFDQAATALTPHQQKRIRRGAAFFMASHQKYWQHDCRFDYISVSKWHINHLKNAF